MRLSVPQGDDNQSFLGWVRFGVCMQLLRLRGDFEQPIVAGDPL